MNKSIEKICGFEFTKWQLHPCFFASVVIMDDDIIVLNGNDVNLYNVQIELGRLHPPYFLKLSTNWYR